MATNFPTSLDTWPTLTDNATVIMAVYINDIQDAIEALEAKVGIDSDSSNTLDYQIRSFWDRYAPRKVYIYNDVAPSGWSTVSDVGDTILGVKGGATFTTGGTKSGAWVITGWDNDTHTHPWYYFSGAYGYTYNISGTAVAMTGYINVGEATGGQCIGLEIGKYSAPLPSWAYTNVCKPTTGSYFYTNNDTHTHTHAGTWRPAGAIGILIQYDG